MEGGKCGMCLEVPENDLVKAVLDITSVCSRCWRRYPERAKKSLAESVEEAVARKMAEGYVAEFCDNKSPLLPLGEWKWVKSQETHISTES